MSAFYAVLITLSGIYLVCQLVAWLFFNKIFFPDAGELFVDKTEKNMLQTIFPKDMLRLVVVIFVGSVIGAILNSLGVIGWLTMPIGALGGVVVNFIINTLISPAYFKIHKSGEPTEEQLSGMTGKVIEDIDPEFYGVIEVWHGKKSYLIRAVSANDRYIRKGERVVVIHSENECCFVESEDHLCDILFEDGNEFDTDEGKEENE